MSSYSRILIIRRDNIGDLVCTLPLIRRLRNEYPDAWIGALVTRYNAEVLHDNPDLDAVFSYTKAKHLAHGESRLGALWQRLRVLWRLRHADLDLVLLPASGEQASARRMAKLVGAKRVVTQDDAFAVHPIPTSELADLHEAERTANILRALAVEPGQLAAACIYPRAEIRNNLLAQIGATGAAGKSGGMLVGVHISSRKPSQRWPAERFVEFIQRLLADAPTMRFALLWSPGDENNPLHPGDDRKAKAILDACAHLPVRPCPSQQLADLIASLSICDRILCSDGGHMHLAAAVGKPIICLFGKSDAMRWHPWKVPYRLLQPESENVSDVSVTEALAAFKEL